MGCLQNSGYQETAFKSSEMDLSSLAELQLLFEQEYNQG